VLLDNSSDRTELSLGGRLKGLVAKSKLWIENENGEVVFGEGRSRILEAIEKQGSINAAALELHMSYRAVWGKIQKAESRLGQPLLLRKTGGIYGGGSELTPFARQIVELYRGLKVGRETALERLSEDFSASGKSGGRGDIMSEKEEILVCLGAAAAANSVPCFDHYFRKASEAGITPEEVQKAVELGCKIKTADLTVMKKSIRDITGKDWEFEQGGEG
jgi:molybdate transport system regulatory protein